MKFCPAIWNTIRSYLGHITQTSPALQRISWEVLKFAQNFTTMLSNYKLGDSDLEDLNDRLDDGGEVADKWNLDKK